MVLQRTPEPARPAGRARAGHPRAAGQVEQPRQVVVAAARCGQLPGVHRDLLAAGVVVVEGDGNLVLHHVQAGQPALPESHALTVLPAEQRWLDVPMLPWNADLAGSLDQTTITSELLRGNPLGDPHERPLWVYTPPGYDDGSTERYPAVYVIQGYTGHVAMWANRTPFRQPFTETADQVFADGSTPPCIVVYVDAWTTYGGSQFVDSAGTGRYHSYLCDEVVPFVDEHYRTIADRDSRAISRQVQRRVRRDDHADAAARRVRRARDACR